MEHPQAILDTVDNCIFTLEELYQQADRMSTRGVFSRVWELWAAYRTIQAYADAKGVNPFTGAGNPAIRLFLDIAHHASEEAAAIYQLHRQYWHKDDASPFTTDEDWQRA